MAGVLGIYGLIVAVIIQGSSKWRAVKIAVMLSKTVFLISFFHSFQSRYLLLVVQPSIPVLLDMPIYLPVFAADLGKN